MSSDGYKRQMRHFLIDKKFQLKYTLIIVLISSVVCIVLGFFIFRANVDIRKAHQQIYEANRESSELVALGSLDPEIKEVFSELLRKEDEAVRARYEAAQIGDRKVLLYLIGFLGLLVFCLTIVGIVATHKIAGPAYSMQRVLQFISEGNLPEGVRLRRKDELQHVGDELQRVINTLRDTESREIEALEVSITALRDRMSEEDESIARLRQLLSKKQLKLSK